MTHEITTASPDDEELVAGMMREFYAVERLRFDAAASPVALRALLADPALGQVLLVRCDGEAAGYLVLTFGFSLEFHGRSGLVDELYVRPAFQGRGLGRAALAHAEEAARAADAHVLGLEVDRTNDRARALYGRTGYADRGNHLLTKWLAPVSEGAAG